MLSAFLPIVLDKDSTQDFKYCKKVILKYHKVRKHQFLSRTVLFIGNIQLLFAFSFTFVMGSALWFATEDDFGPRETFSNVCQHV